jgi:SAM-dependent methyltransferase
VKQHPGTAYFAAVGDALGPNYLRYSFTKGTEQEVRFLVDLLRLGPGARVLDVGCGAGRHAMGLAKAGLSVTGIDISAGLLAVARDNASAEEVNLSLFQMDAREMPFEEEFDAAISICQGAFGLMGGDDPVVLRKIAAAVKPEGKVVLTAFSALFEASHPRPEATFDADAGVVHESTVIKTADGADREVDLWTNVYTPRELRLMAIGVGLIPEEIWAVEPGDFARRAPDLEHPEFMLLARRPEWS